jgi:hypothetical protein
MAKKVSASVLDGGLDAIAACTEMYVCTSEPLDRAAAISASLVGAVVLDAADFTKAAGTGTNRKITVAQQADIPITSSGDATHVVLCTGTEMRVVTTCTLQTLTSGGTVTVPAFEYESQQPI